MAPGFRKFLKRIFILINIVTVALLALASLSAYVNPGKYWVIGMLGVAYVFFLVLVVLFLLFWLIMRSKWAWLSFAALVVCWSQIHAVVALHPFAKFDLQKKEPGAIRIVQWNLTSWSVDFKGKRYKYRDEMFDYLKEQNADVMCFQEFFESNTPRFYEPTIDLVVNKLHYPYHYFAQDGSWWKGGLRFGVAIFSRYPILDTTQWKFKAAGKKEGESLICTTLDINGQKINLFTTHLQSFRFKEKDYDNIAILKSPEGNKGKLVKAGKGIMYKFRSAYATRHLQADKVREALDKSEYPSIITGDFNDVPNSYTYSTIKGDYQDAFVKKSAGIGRTFFSISPTLRIDYILADKNFEVLQYKRDKRPWSDHFPVVSDLIIRTPKS